jgi:fatty acid desaturase
MRIYIPNALLVLAYCTMLCVVQQWPWKAWTAIPAVIVGFWIVAVTVKADANTTTDRRTEEGEK